MSKSNNRGSRRILEKEYGKFCMICGRRLKKGLATFHHIKKLCEGGETTPENGGLVCKHCHPLIHKSLESEKYYNDIIRDYKKRNKKWGD